MYNFEYAKIFESSLPNELENEIKRLKHLRDNFGNTEQGIKVFINSIYGATASPYFFGYNTFLAEAITLQGQDIIKFSSKLANKYFREYWHKDVKLHKILGITDVQPLLQDVNIYGDTDSIYITLQELFKTCTYTGNEIDIINKISNLRLKNFFKQAFEKYASKFNTENIQNFELETISFSSIMLKKKKYVLDIAWTDTPAYFKPQTNVKSKGIEIVQSSTPPFARKYLQSLLIEILRDKKQLNISKFVKRMKELRQEFELDSMDNITMQSSIGDYEKFIANDTTRLELNSHCPFHIKGAGYYNLLLNKNKKLKTKYNLAKSGDKIKYYYAKIEQNGGVNCFAYLPGMHPIEFAPSIDFDTQFSKAIIDPINRFVETLGFPRISPELIISKQLF